MDPQEKSAELRNTIFSNKQLRSSATNFNKNSSKGVSPLKERNKDNRPPKSNTPLMNIMLKKLAEQKISMKKVPY